MKTHKILRDIEESLRSYLGLKYHLIGVKVIEDEGEVNESFQSKVSMAFCQIVRLASVNGKVFLHNLDYERCPIAQDVFKGEKSEYVENSYGSKSLVKGEILVSPLNKMDDLPEIILAILTPKQMMDLTVILQSGEKKPLSVEFTGKRACLEFYVKPYMERKPNISLLCSGAREIYSNFRDNEIVFGAPLETFIQATKTIDRITRIGGALCGCRTSDIPTEIIKEFEKIGFSKGTDYFFGKMKGRNIRIYLNKDLNGRLKFITIHLSMRTPSEEAAEKLTEKLRDLIQRPYFVDKRSYWLDLTVRESEEALGIDLFDGSSIKDAIERFIEKLTQYLSKVEWIHPHGED